MHKNDEDMSSLQEYDIDTLIKRLNESRDRNLEALASKFEKAVEVMKEGKLLGKIDAYLNDDVYRKHNALIAAKALKNNGINSVELDKNQCISIQLIDLAFKIDGFANSNFPVKKLDVFK